MSGVTKKLWFRVDLILKMEIMVWVNTISIPDIQSSSLRCCQPIIYTVGFGEFSVQSVHPRRWWNASTVKTRIYIQYVLNIHFVTNSMENTGTMSGHQTKNQDLNAISPMIRHFRWSVVRIVLERDQQWMKNIALVLTFDFASEEAPAMMIVFALSVSANGITMITGITAKERNIINKRHTIWARTSIEGGSSCLLRGDLESKRSSGNMIKRRCWERMSITRKRGHSSKGKRIKNQIVNQSNDSRDDINYQCNIDVYQVTLRSSNHFRRCKPQSLMNASGTQSFQPSQHVSQPLFRKKEH